MSPSPWAAYGHGHRRSGVLIGVTYFRQVGLAVDANG